MKAHWKYLKYVIRHKWFVLLAGLKLGVPLWQLIVHDWTKFLPSEWFPYVRFFYRDYPEWESMPSGMKYEYTGPTKESVKAQFNIAWLHHQNRNKHHWQYWVLMNDDGPVYPIPMPDKYMREMVADWAGAGRAIAGKWDLANWYANNKGKMKLGDAERVDELVAKFTASMSGVAHVAEAKGA